MNQEVKEWEITKPADVGRDGWNVGCFTLVGSTFIAFSTSARLATTELSAGSISTAFFKSARACSGEEDRGFSYLTLRAPKEELFTSSSL